jgi:hypothetical protein
MYSSPISYLSDMAFWIHRRVNTGTRPQSSSVIRAISLSLLNPISSRNLMSSDARWCFAPHSTAADIVLDPVATGDCSSWEGSGCHCIRLVARWGFCLRFHAQTASCKMLTHSPSPSPFFSPSHRRKLEKCGQVTSWSSRNSFWCWGDIHTA